MSDRARVLLVDDESDFLALTIAFLHRHEARFDIETAESVDQGLSLLDSQEFECVVSDYEMPDSDGITFLRAVRELDSELPFILFTGRGGERVASEAITAGVTAYLQKGSPQQFELLSNRIVNAVEQREAMRRSAEIERRYSALFEHATDAIVWVEREEGDPIVRDANRVFTSEIVQSVDELIGRDLVSIIDEDGRVSGAEKLAAALDTGEGFDLRVKTEDETRVYRCQPVLVQGDTDGDGGERFLICTDRTEQRAIERRYRTFVERSTDIISVLAPEGEIHYLSPSIQPILGYDPDELIGENAFSYVHPTDRPRIWEVFEHGVANGQMTSVEYRFEHADGSWRWIESRGSNELDTPTIEGFVINSRDITDRVRAREQLQQQNERLEEFASIVSHELKDPLSVAEGRLSLARGELENEHLDTVARAHDRMNTLIDDLLEYALAGRAAMDLERMDVEVIARECWRDIGAPDARLETDIDRRIEADGTRIRQLFQNLFGNAVEHGGEQVTVRLGELDGGFFIADDGPGIPASERRTVFDPGYSTGENGQGFGLPIVKEIVDVHGWDLALAESERGGARFEIRGIEAV